MLSKSSQKPKDTHAQIPFVQKHKSWQSEPMPRSRDGDPREESYGGRRASGAGTVRFSIWGLVTGMLLVKILPAVPLGFLHSSGAVLDFHGRLYRGYLLS